jgi:tetratricopeptide (TPR) repeat protein
MKRLITAAGIGGSLLLAQAAFAQTGMARGKVLDDKGQPIPGAKVTWEYMGGITRKGEVGPNKKGEFVQVGLQPGNYRFTATAEGYQSDSIELRIGLGDPTAIPEFKLKPKSGAAGGAAPDAAMVALRASVDQAIALDAGGKTDEALAIYADLATKHPTIHQLPYNMGLLYAKKKDWANAEAMYKKALELRPDYADAVMQLSTVYVNAGRAAEATELLAKAVGENPGEPKLLLQQGVIFFNTGKQAEAAEVFQKLVAADPTSPEPYYYLGTIAVGQGKTAECIASLEKYLSLNPQGPNVATAKGLLAALKK